MKLKKPIVYDYENIDFEPLYCCCCGSKFRFCLASDLSLGEDLALDFWEPTCDCYETAEHSVNCEFWGDVDEN